MESVTWIPHVLEASHLGNPQCPRRRFWVLMGTVCSSWVHLNVGTSKRSILLPSGDESKAYIRDANSMLSRTSVVIPQSFCK